MRKPSLSLKARKERKFTNSKADFFKSKFVIKSSLVVYLTFSVVVICCGFIEFIIYASIEECVS